MAVGADNYTLPFLANRVLGTRLEIIPGYKGTSDTFVAVEQGEVQGGGTSLLNLMVNRGEWFRDGKAGVVFRFRPGAPARTARCPHRRGTRRDARRSRSFPLHRDEVRDGPPASDAAETFLGTVWTPCARRSTTRCWTLHSSRMQEDRAAVSPMRGVEIQKLVDEIQAIPQPIVDRLRELLGAK